MMKIKSVLENLRRGHVDAVLLSAYLDAQVTPAERRRIEAHLAACVACRQELASLRQTVALVQALPRLRVPHAFTLSAAQVGLDRPARQAAWRGGLVRGLAAVSALVLVAVMAAALLRPGEWQPAIELARVVAPTADVHGARMPEAATTRGISEAAPMLAPAPQPVTVETTTAPTRAAPPDSPTAAATAAPTAALAAVAPTEAPPRRAIAPPTPSDVEKPAAALAVAPAPPAETTAAPTLTAPSVGTRVAAGSAGTASVSADGTPPSAAVKDAAGPRVLAADIALAYAANGELWVLDADQGLRALARGDNLASPVVSASRAWVAYRRQSREGAELWVVLWAGGEPRLLLTEHALNAEPLAGYQPRRIADVQWLADTHALAVTVNALPDAPNTATHQELWLIAAETADRRLLATGDLSYVPVPAPDGTAFLCFRRDPLNPEEGQIWLIPVDGVQERPVLRFSLPDEARRGDLRIRWLPDSGGFWAALPFAEADGLWLYYVPRQGEPGPAVRLEARQAFWSPDGKHLAYVRSVGGLAGTQELFLAAADATQARRYATLLRGRFIAWAADSTYFLYEDGGQLFVGAVDRAAQRLAINSREPRWIGPDAVLYLADHGAVQQLIYHPVGGQPTVLQTWPASVRLDGLWP